MVTLLPGEPVERVLTGYTAPWLHCSMVSQWNVSSQLHCSLVSQWNVSSQVTLLHGYTGSLVSQWNVSSQVTLLPGEPVERVLTDYCSMVSQWNVSSQVTLLHAATVEPEQHGRTARCGLQTLSEAQQLGTTLPPRYPDHRRATGQKSKQRESARTKGECEQACGPAPDR
ncbi:unnamed protein product [Boreogadus saida]